MNIWKKHFTILKHANLVPYKIAFKIKLCGDTMSAQQAWSSTVSHSSTGEAEAENWECEASLGYMASLKINL